MMINLFQTVPPAAVNKPQRQASETAAAEPVAGLDQDKAPGSFAEAIAALLNLPRQTVATTPTGSGNVAPASTGETAAEAEGSSVDHLWEFNLALSGQHIGADSTTRLAAPATDPADLSTGSAPMPAWTSSWRKLLNGNGFEPTQSQSLPATPEPVAGLSTDRKPGTSAASKVDESSAVPVVGTEVDNHAPLGQASDISGSSDGIGQIALGAVLDVVPRSSEVILTGLIEEAFNPVGRVVSAMVPDRAIREDAAADIPGELEPKFSPVSESSVMTEPGLLTQAGTDSSDVMAGAAFTRRVEPVSGQVENDLPDTSINPIHGVSLQTAARLSDGSDEADSKDEGSSRKDQVHSSVHPPRQTDAVSGFRVDQSLSGAPVSPSPESHSASAPPPAAGSAGAAVLWPEAPPEFPTHQVTLVMDGEGGMERVRVSVSGQRVHATIMTDEMHHTLYQERAGQLRHSLGEQGFTDVRVAVRMNPIDAPEQHSGRSTLVSLPPGLSGEQSAGIRSQAGESERSLYRKHYHQDDSGSQARQERRHSKERR